jgi:hypothetical protein
MMWRLHRHSESVKSLTELLNNRHGTGLTEEEVAEALGSLRLKIVAAEQPVTAEERGVGSRVNWSVSTSPRNAPER